VENKVLIDSSGWIDFFRESRPKINWQIQQLLKEDRVLICGPIYVEVVGGCRTEQESYTVSQLYNELSFLELSREDFYPASLINQKLRKKGHALKGMDLLIAYLAIKNNCYLLHNDSDYDRAAHFIPLKILKLK